MIIDILLWNNSTLTGKESVKKIYNEKRYKVRMYPFLTLKLSHDNEWEKQYEKSKFCIPKRVVFLIIKDILKTEKILLIF